jgi:hypothetical protein
MTQGILNLGAKYKLHVSRPGYFTPGPPSTVELWGPKADIADVEKKKSLATRGNQTLTPRQPSDHTD